jgi:AraC-like DNA-binding protein
MLSPLSVSGAHTIRLFRGCLSPGPNWQIQRTLENHLLYVFTGGRLHLECGDQHLRIQAPAALILKQGTPYLLTADPEAPPTFYPIHFHTAEPAEDTPHWLHIPSIPLREMLPTLETMLTLWRLDTPPSRGGAAAGLRMLLAQLVSMPEGRPATPTPEQKIRQVCAQILRHPERRLSLADMAAMAGMSRSGFSDHFKQHTGLSPMRYAIRERCRYAAGLIRDEGFRVNEAAVATGYPDAFSFSKQFRQVMGTAPSRIQQEL